MKTLQQCTWKPFQIKDLFNIKRGNAKEVTKRIMKGETALVTAIDNNNAVSGTTTRNEGEILFCPSITVHNNGNGVGLVFVHSYPFIATSDVTVLTLKNNRFNEYMLRFFVPIIQKHKNKFDYGYKLANNRLMEQTIMLPVTATGEPDYEFMEQYMKEKEEIILSKYHSYISDKIKELGSDENLKPYQWKAFRIGKIFTDIQRGKRLKTGDHIAGQTPYVSSSAIDNGIDGFIGNDKGVRKFEDCLTLANSGSVGATYYQPFQFIASDHVTKLKRPFINKYVYLFLAVMVGKLGEKYSFNREINDSRLQREYIMLPANHEGEPDYEYMEKKMRHIEHLKLLQYIQSKIEIAK